MVDAVCWLRRLQAPCKRLGNGLGALAGGEIGYATNKLRPLGHGANGCFLCAFVSSLTASHGTAFEPLLGGQGQKCLRRIQEAQGQRDLASTASAKQAEIDPM